MFSIHGHAARLCDRITRRELLRVGGLSTIGLSLPALLQARENAPQGVLPADTTFGRAKSVIFLYLQGGPPQHETFDPKPQAPLEIRGPFQPIQTNVPGIHVGELLPRTARIADKLAIVRSISTNDNNHDSSGYWLLTGYKYQGPNSRTIQPTDWPYFGSLVKKLKPSESLPPLSTVWIPDIMRLNENVTPAGQTAGFLGSQWNPDRFVGDPSRPDYRVEGLELSHLPPLQLRTRQGLVEQVQRHFDALARGEAPQAYDKFQRQAFELLISGRAQRAFDMRQEPQEVRRRYGRSQWAQCLVLARRLVEAGVRLVHVNWPREPGDNAVDNPLWDTHARNADRLEDVLCPQFDVGFTALIDDLQQRGLLDETLVVAIGEFGRTPKINSKGGRDHWGAVFSFVLAGAGIRGGQVYGASDAAGAYPARDRLEGGDFTATLFHLLGINPRGTFHDREGREHPLTLGTPVYKLLGSEPATAARVAAGGDVARVPPFDDRLLFNTEFADDVPLAAVDLGPRPKGWRAEPRLEAAAGGFGARLVEAPRGAPLRRGVALGALAGSDDAAILVPQGASIVLAQEVRSPFAGTFTLRVRASGRGASQQAYQALLDHFACRLMFLEFVEADKDPRRRRELAAAAFSPAWCESHRDGGESFELTRTFENPNPGQNFSFGLGLGVALVLERTSPGPLRLPSAAWLEVHSITLEFSGKPRIDTVQV